jgi:hypothetical protein
MIIKNNLIAKIYDVDGNLVNVQEGHNAITDGDATTSTYGNGFIFTLMRLFNDDNSGALLMDEDSAIVAMEMGTGTPDDDGLGTPYTTPDTELAIASLTWDYSTLTEPEILASCSWGPGSPYNVSLSGITEAVLLTGTTGPLSTNEPFAYKTFTPALSKTAGGVITLEWTIAVT